MFPLYEPRCLFHLRQLPYLYLFLRVLLSQHPLHLLFLQSAECLCLFHHVPRLHHRHALVLIPFFSFLFLIVHFHRAVVLVVIPCFPLQLLPLEFEPLLDLREYIAQVPLSDIICALAPVHWLQQTHFLLVAPAVVHVEQLFQLAWVLHSLLLPRHCL